MYLPAHFVEHREDVIEAFISAHPLATVIVAHGGELIANHLPLLWQRGTGSGILRGHIARANPLAELIGEGIDVLAIFHGPAGYISPSLYPSKAATGRVVPTWNYAVVHAHGHMQAITDAAWLQALVSELTATHEGTRAKPWAVSDAPPEFIEVQLRAIIGIEVAVQRFEAKFKLSQNRNEADRRGVIDGLAQSQDGVALASFMADCMRRSK